MMFTQSLRASIVMLLAFTVLFGAVYPGIVTGLAKAVFPKQADGSLIVAGGQVVGSALIGQSFSDPKYFWGRLSATGPVPYNAAASSGGNLGAASPNLKAAVQTRIDALRAAQPDSMASIPADLVTASGSGLDPHISYEAADYQSARIARLRGLSIEQTRQMIADHTEMPQLGILGNRRVNVLTLNRALDEISAE